MRLLLIRHAETVDNVAGVYAGVTDSELTNHGIQQAKQLGLWIKATLPPVTKIFASPLQRTSRTAEAILSAQTREPPENASTSDDIMVKSALLIEQDFGFYEKKPFKAFAPDAAKTRRAAHADIHRSDPGFQDVESAQSMAQRGDKFLDEFLLPQLDEMALKPEGVIIVVSHGIMLSHLWRRFLLRLPRRSITISAEVTSAKGQVILEHLGGWTNTGVLDLELQPQALPQPNSAVQDVVGQGSALLSTHEECATSNSPVHVDRREPHKTPADDPKDAFIGLSTSSTVQARPATTDVASRSIAQQSAVQTPVLAPKDDPSEALTSNPNISAAPSLSTDASPQLRPTRLLLGFALTIFRVNSAEHLRGLKRARGGIGSAKYDEGQKSLDSFFKRAKK